MAGVQSRSFCGWSDTRIGMVLRANVGAALTVERVCW